MSKPKVRVEVLPPGTEILHITAAEAEVGDVWLGESELRIDKIEEGDTIEYIPWPQGRGHKTKTGPLVRIHGQIIKGRDRGYKGKWSLQPEQPLEVRRHA